MSTWQTYWFVVCWTNSGPSYRAGPFLDFEEAMRQVREQVTRDGQTIGLMETVPQAVMTGESNARIIAGPHKETR
jgi:hypothetical protein